MVDTIGEQLTDVQVGDTVVVTVSNTQYTGEVVDTTRRKCNTDPIGLIESGGVTIYLDLDTTTSEVSLLASAQLRIRATEEVPFSWDDAKAYLYHPETEDSEYLDTVTDLDIETENEPSSDNTDGADS